MLLAVAGAVVAVPQSLEVAVEHGVCAPAATGSDLLGAIVYRGSREQPALFNTPWEGVVRSRRLRESP
jgi:hypothetical protein